MSSSTPNLNLLKKNPMTDGSDTFNIQTMLNDNWDKIDDAVVAKEISAKSYADTKDTAHLAAADPHTQYALDTDLTAHLADTTQYSIYKSGLDANGIYTVVDHKRSDGTLILHSVLSGGTSPKYTTRTETYYKSDGATVDKTIAYTITYDANGMVASEVRQ